MGCASTAVGGAFQGNEVTLVEVDGLSFDLRSVLDWLSNGGGKHRCIRLPALAAVLHFCAMLGHLDTDWRQVEHLSRLVATNRHIDQ